MIKSIRFSWPDSANQQQMLAEQFLRQNERIRTAVPIRSVKRDIDRFWVFYVGLLRSFRITWNRALQSHAFTDGNPYVINHILPTVSLIF